MMTEDDEVYVLDEFDQDESLYLVKKVDAKRQWCIHAWSKPKYMSLPTRDTYEESLIVERIDSDSLSQLYERAK